MSCRDSSIIITKPDAKLSSLQIKQTMEKKNEWLVSKQADSLTTIIHPQAIYGHSNCWVQSSDDLINNEPLDSLTYLSIDIEDLEINPIGSTGIVSGVGHFVGIFKRDTFDMRLCFVETYANVEDKWMLIGRQAAKVPKD